MTFKSDPGHADGEQPSQEAKEQMRAARRRCPELKTAPAEYKPDVVTAPIQDAYVDGELL